MRQAAGSGARGPSRGDRAGRYRGGGGGQGRGSGGGGSGDDPDDPSFLDELDDFLIYCRGAGSPGELDGWLRRERSAVSFEMVLRCSEQQMGQMRENSRFDDELLDVLEGLMPAPRATRLSLGGIQVKRSDAADCVTLAVNVKVGEAEDLDALIEDLNALIEAVSKDLRGNAFHECQNLLSIAPGLKVEKLAEPELEWRDHAPEDPLSSHSDDAEPADDASRWARYANKLLAWEADFMLSQSHRNSVDELPEWKWGRNRICRCNGCAKWLQGHCFLYTEKLERATPWYRDEQAPHRSDGTIGASSSVDADAGFDKEVLLNCARDHWSSFFGPLQDLMEQECAMDVPFTRDALPSNIPTDLIDANTGRLNRLAYATAALLNDIRRDRQRTLPPQGTLPLQLSERVPPFKFDYRCNFEGTKDDNYCLGCRVSGCKWYIGVSDDEPRRHRQHRGEELDGGKYIGAYYIGYLTRLNSSQVCPKPDAFGGWRLTDNPEKPEEAHSVCPRGSYTAVDEDANTRNIAFKHGLHHVRGGVHVLPELSGAELITLQREYRAQCDLCILCGRSGHKAATCTQFRGQSVSEDAALMDFVRLRGDDPTFRADDRAQGVHADVARRVASGVCSACHVSRLVAVSFPMTTEDMDDMRHDDQNEGQNGEISAHQARETYEHLVRELYGRRVDVSKLRKLQCECLEHVVDLGRPDIVLTAPTSYGKTLTYLVAAVHEVVYGEGKAVIFLPFSALMSELAHTLAELTDDQYSPVYRKKGRVITHEADPRVVGTSLPYGGRLRIRLPKGQGSREISWTIWRGVSGDPIMRQHLRTGVFRHADIILATPDKWMWPDSFRANGCDSFLSMLPPHALTAEGALAPGQAEHAQAQTKREWLRKLGLIIADEAHELQGVLGGSMSELIRRMRTLRGLLPREGEGGACERLRVMLVSATIERKEEFYRQLLRPDMQPGWVAPPNEVKYVEAPAVVGAQTCRIVPEEFESEGEDDVDPVSADEASSAVDWLQEQGEQTRQRLMLLINRPIAPADLVEIILRPDVLMGVPEASRDGSAAPDAAEASTLPCDLRRVLIFIDSKVMCSQLVRDLSKPGFKKLWSDSVGVTVSTTPYHGDVARRDRRLYEKNMGEFMPKRQLHFIVATSALEAGVNVRGTDVVILLSTKYCSQSSVLQRLGRCARKANQPGVCIVGVRPKDDLWSSDQDDEWDPTADSDDDDDDDDDGVSQSDAEPDEGGGAVQCCDFLRHPEEYLTFRSNALPAVTRTPAIVLNGIRQFIRDAKVLLPSGYPPAANGGDNAIIVAAKDLLRTSPCATVLDQLIRREHWNDPISLLDDHLNREITMRDSRNQPLNELMSARGLGQTNTVTLVLVDEFGDVVRKGRQRLGRVEKGRADAMRCFRDLHWHAQLLTPHGEMVIVTGIELAHNARRAAERRWLSDVRYIRVRYTNAELDVMPNHRTKGDYATRLTFIDTRALGDIEDLSPRIKIGTVECMQEWLGFYYVNPINNKRIEDFQDVRRPGDWRQKIGTNKKYGRTGTPTHLLEGFPLFQPTLWETSGWVWHAGEPLPDCFPLQADMQLTVLHVLAFELQWRAKEELKCPMDLMRWVLFARTISSPQTSASNQKLNGMQIGIDNPWHEHDPPQGPAGNAARNDQAPEKELCVMMHEVSALGLARECSRQERIQTILPNRNPLADFSFAHLEVGKLLTESREEIERHNKLLLESLDVMEESVKHRVAQCWIYLCRRFAA